MASWSRPGRMLSRVLGVYETSDKRGISGLSGVKPLVEGQDLLDHVYMEIRDRFQVPEV